jgi:RloB-like protein
MEKRKKGNKKGPKTTLIVCEGYTEENMAIREKNRRKISAITILNMKGSSPIEIIETAKRKFFEDGGYDKVFCIFDRDKHGSFTKALQEVQNLAGQRRKKDRIPIIIFLGSRCTRL